MNILLWTGDKEIECATRRVCRDQVSFIYDGEVMDNFVKEGNFNFSSPFLQGAPSQIIHIDFSIAVNHGAVSGCKTVIFCYFFQVYRFSNTDPKRNNHSLGWEDYD